MRRRTVASDISSPRRRVVNYGYPGRDNLQQNYGYNFPEKTSYGYSGSGPKQYSKTHVAMAAVGGAALGVGGYYLYHQMANNNWGSNIPYTDRSWCTAPSGQYQGRMMRCNDCAQAFGTHSCRSNNDCFGPSGCQHELQQSTQRDDLMATGFIPLHYTPPLTLTITGISGTGYAPSNICPAIQPTGAPNDDWLRKSSFQVEMYVTLTQVKDFTPPGNVGTANGCIGVAVPSWWLLLSFAALGLWGSRHRL